MDRFDKWKTYLDHVVMSLCRDVFFSGAQVTSKVAAPVPDDIQEVDMDVDEDEEEEVVAQWSSVVPGEEKATEKSFSLDAEGLFLFLA